MKDRKYSETTDTFLYQILSKKCNQFMSSYNTPKSHQIMQISQTLKMSTSQIKTTKTTKTIVTKNKIFYSNIVSQSTLREVTLQHTIKLPRKEEQLLAELMRRIIQNIKIKLQDILCNINSFLNNKEVFKKIVILLEEDFELINEELIRAKKYTKRKQLRDVINLQIDRISTDQFVALIFSTLPNLKDYFIKFQIQTFTNQQIQEFKQYALIYDLIDIDSQMERRSKEKKTKKKNKKKKNKNIQQTSQSTNGGQQSTQNEKKIHQRTKQQNKVVQFLQSMVINESRIGCNVSDDWIKNLQLKYAR